VLAYLTDKLLCSVVYVLYVFNSYLHSPLMFVTP
jgi:hypothetical protein